MRPPCSLPNRSSIASLTSSRDDARLDSDQDLREAQRESDAGAILTADTIGYLHAVGAVGFARASSMVATSMVRGPTYLCSTASMSFRRTCVTWKLTRSSASNTLSIPCQ